MFTLTIYFIAINVYVEFVLIYRPHPVYSTCNWGGTDKNKQLTIIKPTQTGINPQ